MRNQLGCLICFKNVFSLAIFESVLCVLKVEKTVWDWELMNDIKPIWQRQAKEIEEDEYTAFYKTFSKVRHFSNAFSNY